MDDCLDSWTPVVPTESCDAWAPIEVFKVTEEPDFRMTEDGQFRIIEGGLHG